MKGFDDIQAGKIAAPKQEKEVVEEEKEELVAETVDENGRKMVRNPSSRRPKNGLKQSQTQSFRHLKKERMD